MVKLTLQANWVKQVKHVEHEQDPFNRSAA